MYDIKTIEFGQQQQQQQSKLYKQNNCHNASNHCISDISVATLPELAHTNNTTHSKYSKYSTQLQQHTNFTHTFLTSPNTYSNSSTNNNINNNTTCSIIASAAFPTSIGKAQQQQHNTNSASYRSSPPANPADTTHMTLLSLRRRRLFQRQACLLSILAAFIFGLALGVFMPLFGLANIFGTLSPTTSITAAAFDDDASGGVQQVLPVESIPMHSGVNRSRLMVHHPPSDFPTIYEMRIDAAAATAEASSAAAAGAAEENPFKVAFIREPDVTLTAEQVFRNAFHLEQDKNSPGAMIVKKLDASDGSIKEFRVQRISDGRFRKGPERRLSKPSLTEQVLQSSDTIGSNTIENINFVPLAQGIVENTRSEHNQGIIKADIYWGDLVERALPHGFTAQESKDWNSYVTTSGIVERLESGCGRMQNRLVVFADGTRACARYRQNTDQIQGELFSFYLGQLLNLGNLAPSSVSVIDLESKTWSSVVGDITQAQWKQQRPVVLTRWLSELESSGIPQPFQPLERHLNKYDVWNITLGAAAELLQSTAAAAETLPMPTSVVNADSPSLITEEQQNGLLKRLGAASSATQNHQSPVFESSYPLAATAAAAEDSSPPSTAAAFSPNALFASLNATHTASPPSVVLQRLIELAQWSDLIVFDYLIANLDRVVNNLYNFQWNADIMAAPAHNLARQIKTQLLVFLDNESGLLHGYRLLKKYEAYHGLLLDNLCVFRQPTIEALRQLRAYGAGRKLRELFEETTSTAVRDVLPSLPDKSIKILVDRIDRVLGQVQKCRDLLADS